MSLRIFYVANYPGDNSTYLMSLCYKVLPPCDPYDELITAPLNLTVSNSNHKEVLGINVDHVPTFVASVFTKVNQKINAQAL